jgi:hypothetical protein
MFVSEFILFRGSALPSVPQSCASKKRGTGPREVLCRLDAPTHTQAKKLLDFWNTRPADGIVMGRDVPSRRIAPLLSNIMIWEPVDGDTDFVIHHIGEGAQIRFGGNAKGRRMTEMFPPEAIQLRQNLYAENRDGDHAIVLDVRLYSDVIELMHFELVLLPVRSSVDGPFWVLAGIFYFR